MPALVDVATPHDPRDREADPACQQHEDQLDAPEPIRRDIDVELPHPERRQHEPTRGAKQGDQTVVRAVHSA